MNGRKQYTRVEARERSGADDETLRFFVHEEWIHPIAEDLFDEEDLARIRLIQELQEDLGVNSESVPIILNLLDQIYSLRAVLRKVEER